MKVFLEVGFLRAFQYFYRTVLRLGLNLVVFPQARATYLRLCGARIGKSSILNHIAFTNLHRGGFGNLSIGDDCYIGTECLMDLSEKVDISDQVSLGDRCVLLTHCNVGLRDHPLQKYLPASSGPIKIERGVAIGACTFIAANVTICENVIIIVPSTVTKNITQPGFYAGSPIQKVRDF